MARPTVHTTRHLPQLPPWKAGPEPPSAKHLNTMQDAILQLAKGNIDIGNVQDVKFIDVDAPYIQTADEQNATDLTGTVKNYDVGSDEWVNGGDVDNVLVDAPRAYATHNGHYVPLALNGLAFRNDSCEEVPPCAVLAIRGWAKDDDGNILYRDGFRVLSIEKPSDDSMAYVLNSGKAVAIDGFGRTAPGDGNSMRFLWDKQDSDEDDPDQGDEYGPVSGKWAVYRNRPSICTVGSVETNETDGTGGADTTSEDDEAEESSSTSGDSTSYSFLFGTWHDLLYARYVTGQAVNDVTTDDETFLIKNVKILDGPGWDDDATDPIQDIDTENDNQLEVENWLQVDIKAGECVMAWIAFAKKKCNQSSDEDESESSDESSDESESEESSDESSDESSSESSSDSDGSDDGGDSGDGEDSGDSDESGDGGDSGDDGDISGGSGGDTSGSGTDTSGGSESLFSEVSWSDSAYLDSGCDTPSETCQGIDGPIIGLMAINVTFAKDTSISQESGCAYDEQQDVATVIAAGGAYKLHFNGSSAADSNYPWETTCRATDGSHLVYCNGETVKVLANISYSSSTGKYTFTIVAQAGSTQLYYGTYVLDYSGGDSSISNIIASPNAPLKIQSVTLTECGSGDSSSLSSSESSSESSSPSSSDSSSSSSSSDPCPCGDVISGGSTVTLYLSATGKQYTLDQTATYEWCTKITVDGTTYVMRFSWNITSWLVAIWTCGATVACANTGDWPNKDSDEHTISGCVSGTVKVVGDYPSNS